MNYLIYLNDNHVLIDSTIRPLPQNPILSIYNIKHTLLITNRSSFLEIYHTDLIVWTT